MYCIDIKPVNIVYKKTDPIKHLSNDNITIKFIDFGKCLLGTKIGTISNDLLYVINLMQIIGTMCIMDKDVRLSNKLMSNAIKNCRPFFNDKVLHKYLNDKDLLNKIYNYVLSVKNEKYLTQYLVISNIIALYSPSYDIKKIEKFNENFNRELSNDKDLENIQVMMFLNKHNEEFLDDLEKKYDEIIEKRYSKWMNIRNYYFIEQEIKTIKHIRNLSA
jgi:hypothetical protein